MAEKTDQELDLLRAAEEGDIAAVWSFIVADVDINCKNGEGWTPLHFASYRGKTDVVALLIREDAADDVINKEGDTPMHLAASNGQAEIVALLVCKGAVREVKNKEGHTPLHTAAVHKNGIVVVVLLAAECELETALKGLDLCAKTFLLSYADKTAKNFQTVTLEAMRLMSKYDEEPQKFDAEMARLLTQLSGLATSTKPSALKTLNDPPDQVAPIGPPEAAAAPLRIMFDLNARRSAMLKGDRPHPGRTSRFWLAADGLMLDSKEAASKGKGGVRKAKLGERAVDVEIIPLVNSDVFHPVVVSLVTAVVRIMQTTAFCHHICKYAGITQQSCFLLVVRNHYQETLTKRIARQKAGSTMTVLESLEIALAMAQGLEELHILNLMHGHLTLDHVLLPQGKGDAVLALNFSTTETFSSKADALQATQEDQSDYYRPPELFPVGGRVQAITAGVDIWAFGCVIVHMLTGKPPLCGCTTSDIMLSKKGIWIGAKGALERHAIPAGLPEAVEELLSQCFEHDPEERPTARKLITGLRKGLVEVRAAARLAKNSMAVTEVEEPVMCCVCKERPYKIKFDHTVYTALYSATAFGEGTYTVACERCARRIIARGSVCPVCGQPIAMAD